MNIGSSPQFRSCDSHQGTIQLIDLDAIDLFATAQRSAADLGMHEVVGDLSHKLVHARDVADYRCQNITERRRE